MWYVIQVWTGKEQEIIAECNEKVLESGEDMFVMLGERMMKDRAGIWEKRKTAVFPGYVFVETKDIEGLKIRLRNVKKMTRILTTGSELTPVYPEEEELLRRLGGDEHLIELSEGYREGDRLVVTDGPLVGLEGYVKWSKSHRRIACIELELCGQKISVKLGFEFLEKISEKKPRNAASDRVHHAGEADRM